MESDAELIDELVELAQRHPDRLTPWELDFAESLDGRSTLSEKQAQIVYEILDKRGS